MNNTRLNSVIRVDKYAAPKGLPTASLRMMVSGRTSHAGNPLRFTDPSGLSCLVLNYGNVGDQHLAMLIQNEDGKWQYYSVNGNDVYLSGSFTGGRRFNDVAVGNWDSVEDFLSSDFFNNRNADGTKVDEDDRQENEKVIKYEFTEACLIHSTPEQDAVMRNEFNSIVNAHDYKLMTNNCAHAVQKSLLKAGIPVSTKKPQMIHVPANMYYGEGGFSYMESPYNAIPSAAFKSIMKANPNGVYFKKKENLWIKQQIIQK